MGNHQLAVALASQEKLAFQGPVAIKWTYTLMPFRPTNGPVMFITFIHDIDSQLKALAQQSGLIIDDKTSTKIIVDDIFQLVWIAWKGIVIHGMSALRLLGLPTLIELVQELHLFQAFRVCWYWCLSRWKSSCHVKTSTSWLLAPTGVHLGCCKKYQVCTILRKTHPSFWASNCPTFQPNNQTWIYWACCAMLDNCLPRFPQWHKTSHLIRSMPEAFWPQPPHRLTVDLSSKGFGYIVCQPGKMLLQPWRWTHCSGLDFSFMTKDSMAVLHQVTFGARSCRRNEVWLHSHLILVKDSLVIGPWKMLSHALQPTLCVDYWLLCN